MPNYVNFILAVFQFCRQTDRHICTWTDTTKTNNCFASTADMQVIINLVKSYLSVQLLCHPVCSTVFYVQLPARSHSVCYRCLCCILHWQLWQPLNALTHTVHRAILCRGLNTLRPKVVQRSTCREYNVHCCTQCSQSAAYSCEQFLQVQQIGFVTLGPLRHA